MIPDRTHRNTSNPQLDVLSTDDGSKSIHDHALDETYHSGCGALLESLHVYAMNSGLLERCHRSSSDPISVLEYGFGLGWNFVLSASLAAVYGVPLRYVGLENRLLPCDVLTAVEIAHGIEVAYPEPQPPGLVRQAREIEQSWLGFRAAISDQIRPQEVQHDFGSDVGLELFLGNASHCSTERWRESFDIVYFDPFSPKTNPELWAEPVLRNAWMALRQGGVLTSYCVKAEVRNTLSQIGFQVERRKGPPGGKREVLRAVKSL